ncbi:hypothetical protein [Streptomyces sp. NPDC059894]|uniref:hypothetical protein n=1 Tax=unclassified Streptomyces TaxID=2593676 RepID=UPI0036655B9A
MTTLSSVPLPVVRGTTRLCVVVGAPVAQARAPGPLDPVLAALGRDAVLVPVHATPLGRPDADPLPFPVADLPPGRPVAEIIMTPPRTALLAAAEAAGLPTHAGIHMLTHQIDSYREFFDLG